ncbi:MAG: hypothetical protein DRP30_02435 [Thermotoga sp.]|nr:MAG: hypothetical protein DRP30_02435 [Thermotoga sp.]
MKEELVFSLPKFEGSLDLLLYLVTKHKMDIMDIQVSIIADEFLDYINKMRKLDINLASDFMVMASTLMEMKSRALLPRRTEREERELEEMKLDLSRRLMEYKKMKELGKFIKEKMEEISKFFPVKVGIERRVEKQDEERNRKLLGRIREIFLIVGRELSLREKVYRIKGERYSVENKMNWIKQKMSMEKCLPLEELLKTAKDKLELLVIFLAFLELVKIGFIRIHERGDTFILSLEGD